MRSDALPLLVDMSRRLTASTDVAAGLRAVSDAARLLVGADHASVRLVDGRRMRSVARSGVGERHPAPAIARGEGVLGWVAQTGRPARVRDAERDPRYRPLPGRGYPVRSILAVPIACDDDVVGVLSMSAARPAAFDREHELMGFLLADHAAHAIRRADLEQQAITDSQTRAFNRRYLLPRLEEELRRAGRAGHPVSVLLMDLDHFKQVNDRFGHLVGDEVLRAFADAVRDHVRGHDALVRRGGEEFVLILPSTGAPAAHAVAERLRMHLTREPLAVRDAIVRQTVSIGIATWDGREPAAALEERADRAMYEAKRGGRNRVVFLEGRGDDRARTA